VTELLRLRQRAHIVSALLGDRSRLRPGRRVFAGKIHRRRYTRAVQAAAGRSVSVLPTDESATSDHYARGCIEKQSSRAYLRTNSGKT